MPAFLLHSAISAAQLDGQELELWPLLLLEPVVTLAVALLIELPIMPLTTLVATQVWLVLVLFVLTLAVH